MHSMHPPGHLSLAFLLYWFRQWPRRQRLHRWHTLALSFLSACDSVCLILESDHCHSVGYVMRTTFLPPIVPMNFVVLCFFFAGARLSIRQLCVFFYLYRSLHQLFFILFTCSSISTFLFTLFCTVNGRGCKIVIENQNFSFKLNPKQSTFVSSNTLSRRSISLSHFVSFNLRMSSSR